MIKTAMLGRLVAPSASQLRMLLSSNSAYSPVTGLACQPFNGRGYSACRQEGVYELRTYSIHPCKMAEFLKLMSEEFHLRTAHSAPLGFWTTELGGLNEVVHIWHYGSLKERAQVRQALAQDPAWYQRFVSKASLTWQRQDNSLLLPHTLITALDEPADKGIYELQTLDMTERPHVWTAPLQQYVDALRKQQILQSSEAAGASAISAATTTEKASVRASTAASSSAPSAGAVHSPRLLGVWQSAVGRLNTAVLLWQYQTMDAAVAAKKNIQAEQDELLRLTSDWRTKLMLPHAVSPLQ